MIQLILDEQVKVKGKAEVEVVGKVRSVVAPWQADDLDCIPLLT
jgi:hypothetical protein